MNIFTLVEPRLTVEEHAEAITAGILSTIKSLEDLIAKHPTVEFNCIEKDLDEAIDRVTDLYVAATKVKRRRLAGLQP